MSIRNIIKNSVMFVSTLTNNNHGSKILYYHDVYATVNHKALDADLCMGTHIDLFARHIEVIRKENYEIVPYITKSQGQVAIMFDDGFNGIWECREFFYKNDIYPTVFLPVEYIGNTLKGILTKEQIIELQLHGFVFESHGWSHRPLTEIPTTELVKELKESRDFLRDLLGKQVSGICLPLGYFSEELIERIFNVGYSEIYSSIPGNFKQKIYGMYHRNLCQYASPKELRLILRGGYEMLHSRYEKQHNHGVKA